MGVTTCVLFREKKKEDIRQRKRRRRRATDALDRLGPAWGQLEEGRVGVAGMYSVLNKEPWPSRVRPRTADPPRDQRSQRWSIDDSGPRSVSPPASTTHSIPVGHAVCPFRLIFSSISSILSLCSYSLTIPARAKLSITPPAHWPADSGPPG